MLLIHVYKRHVEKDLTNLVKIDKQFTKIFKNWQHIKSFRTTYVLPDPALVTLSPGHKTSRNNVLYSTLSKMRFEKKFEINLKYKSTFGFVFV